MDNNWFTFTMVDESIRYLGFLLLGILIGRTNETWTVRGERDNWDFHFICSCGDFVRMTRSLDFTLATSSDEWLSILRNQAEMIAANWREQNNPPCNCWDSQDGKSHIICERHMKENV